MAAATRQALTRPALAGAVFAVRELRFWLTDYRRTWRGSIYSSLLNPLLFLGGMGLGLGALVNKHGDAALGGVSYLSFIAPGLLAAAAMETAIGESTYPVLASVKWVKTYQAATASPLRPADIFHGHMLFVALRLTMNCAIFLAVSAVLGAVHSRWALASLPVAVLTGVAFNATIESWAITRTRDTSFAVIFRFGMIPLFLFSGIFFPITRTRDTSFAVIFRFGMIPLFLFSGIFFPVTQLPGWLQPIAYVTPLWHGVALCRSLSLGVPTLGGALVHVGYLAGLAAIGVAAGNRSYRRRLYV